MEKVALKLPGGEVIGSPNNLKPEFSTLGEFITQLFTVAIFIAVFLSFIWLVWGGFEFILASGNKEEINKARARIKWALIGLIVTLLAYSITRFAGTIFNIKGGLPF